MNHIKALILVILSTLSATAADSPWWSTASVSPYAQVYHGRFGKPSYGAGVDVGLYVNKTVSLHVLNTANESDNWRGSVIDETSFLFKADLVNYAKERVVLSLIGSGDRIWGLDDWGFGAGAGLELRLTKNLSIGADSRIRALFHHDAGLVSRGLVTIRF